MGGQPMKFLVYGCGSIGTRHAKNLRDLGHDVYIYDKDEERAQKLASDGFSVYDFKSHHIQFDGQLVCTPPRLHIPFLEEALKHDANVFVEKPVLIKLDEIDKAYKLLEIAKSKGLTVMPGYQLRYSRGMLAIEDVLDKGTIGNIYSIQAEFGQYLPLWHPYEDYRNLYTGKDIDGGGIILDASHEIDNVNIIAGERPSSVFCASRHMSDLEINVEDNADIILTYPSCIANIHLDMLQREYTRRYKIVGSKGNIKWNYPAIGIEVTNEVCTTIVMPETKVDDDPYMAEMITFTHAIEQNLQITSEFELAIETARIALMCKESSRKGTLEWVL